MDIGPFLTITNEVMDLEVAFHNSHSSVSPHSCSISHQTSLKNQVLAPPPPLPNPLPNLASASTPSPSVTIPPSTHVPKTPLTCSNCKEHGLHATGHTDGTCFQPGEGMKGR